MHVFFDSDICRVYGNRHEMKCSLTTMKPTSYHPAQRPTDSPKEIAAINFLRRGQSQVMNRSTPLCYNRTDIPPLLNA